MAKEPWVTPKEVKSYSEQDKVFKRSDAKLKIDIERAQQYVISYTNNKFSDYERIPRPVKTAVILLAELYANNAAEGKSGYKAESFDDYSYTVAEISQQIDNLNLSSLLDDFVLIKPKQNVTMYLRKL